MDWTALNQMEARAGAQELKELAGKMAARVEENSQCAALLMELFARRLDGPITPESYAPLWEGIATLFGIGDDAPQLFAWLAQGDRHERLEALAEQSPPAFGWLLREVLAVYGERLQQAYRRWREFPHNWEWLQRETYFDIGRGQHRLDLTILKFNDEEVRLSMDARSLLSMVARLTNSLTAVATTPFTELELADLRQETDAFWGAIQANQSEVPAEEKRESAVAG
ncbi:MAG: hypothetical protein ACTHK6_08545 [Solirubrobacterales bacterium]